MVGNLLTQREQKKRDVDFPVFMDDHDGAVRFLEGDSFSIFFIKGNQVITPTLDAGILPGITRKVVINLIKEDSDLELLEAPVLVSDLSDMDEVFITSSNRHVMPVQWIDEHQFVVSDKSHTQLIQTKYLDLLNQTATLTRP